MLPLPTFSSPRHHKICTLSQINTAIFTLGFPGVSVAKNLPMQETQV